MCIYVYFQTGVGWVNSILLPLVISAINFILPFAFSILATFEKFQAPKTELYFTMFRLVFCLLSLCLNFNRTNNFGYVELSKKTEYLPKIAKYCCKIIEIGLYLVITWS